VIYPRTTVSLRTALIGALFMTVIPSVTVAILVERYVEARQLGRADSERLAVEVREAQGAHMVSLLNQEVGLRGYLATGDERFLQPYALGQRQEVAALVALEAKVARADDEALHARLEELEAATRQWHDFIEPEVAQRRGGALPSLGDALVAGKARFDAIRRAGDNFRSADAHAAEGAMALRRAEVHRARWVEAGALLAVLAAAAIAIAWIVRNTAGPIARLAAMAQAGQTSNVADGVRVHEVLALNQALLDRDRKVLAREEDLRAEHDGAVALRGFVERMQQHVDEGEVASDLVRTFTRRHGAVAVRVARLSPSEGRLDPVVPQMDAAARARHLVLAEPKRCRALRSASVVLVDDATSEAACDCSYGVPSDGAYACFPMSAGGEQIGLVTVHRGKGAWTGEEKSALDVYVSSAATAMSSISLLRTARESALHDGLTGVYNRRFFDEVLPKLVAQASRQERPLALLMLDIDHFKRFNDTFGHETGDRVIVAFARSIVDSVRAADVVVRYGGEEFAVILPHTSRADALTLAERVRSNVKGIPFDDSRLRVTTSIGVAALPEDASDRDGLARAADAALYRAKREGRDRVEAAGAPRSAGNAALEGS
jgi:diguanylate cyclase (GGDEF)-like protein